MAEQVNRFKYVDEDGEPMGGMLDRLLSLQQKNPELLTDVEITKGCVMGFRWE